MADKQYTLKNFRERGGESINLSDFYSRLSNMFPSLRPQKLPPVGSKVGGTSPTPILTNVYALGENKLLTVLYYLNYTFGNNCQEIELIQDQRTIEKIEIIPQNIDVSSKKKLEELIARYS